MNPQLICDGTPGLNASFLLEAQDAQGVSWPAHGTATIDDYASAFLVSLGGGAFQILPKITMAPGDQPLTVTATFNLVDAASGAPLPPFALSVDLVAPPAPGQKATHVVVTAGPSAGSGSNATDPGTPTISVSL